jgi:hypothetical protein
VALFSDIDWMIIAVVAAFLLFGRENGQFVRSLGRWYGRALKLKQDLVSEVARSADLPVGAIGGAPGLRATLLGLDPEVARASRIPAAVTTPPGLPPGPPAPPPVPWTGGLPILSWSVTGGAPAGSEAPR